MMPPRRLIGRKNPCDANPYKGRTPKVNQDRRRAGYTSISIDTVARGKLEHFAAIYRARNGKFLSLSSILLNILEQATQDMEVSETALAYWKSRRYHFRLPTGRPPKPGSTPRKSRATAKALKDRAAPGVD